MNKVIIFNPRSANAKHRVPNSILQVGAAIHDKFEYVLVDGNMETDPEKKILDYLATGEFKFFGSTVMPGPQLSQAIPITKKVKTAFPEVITIWGGYFASNQYKVCLQSKWIDFIIDGPGDLAFPQLLEALIMQKRDFSEIKNLAYLKDGIPFKTAKEALLDQDSLPPLPYGKLNEHYPLENYLGRTFLGNKTLAYHSSFGCPFTCSFCAVVPIYNARWKGKSARLIAEDVLKLKEEHGVDSIEFHDNNFFTSRKRVVEFAELVKNENLIWWGEGRIDTINKYSDEDLKLMHEAGCKMIFLGAETGNDEVLKKMDKGGTQTGAEIKSFVARMAKVGIIPELSFVLGLPAESEEKVMKQIDEDIEFIKEIKRINPDAEIIIYLYSPVPTEGSELYEEIKRAGFSFPENLEDWLSPSWEKFDLRKNPLTPWLTPKMVDKIRDFEKVLNGYFPTVSDFRIKGYKKFVLKTLSGWRYNSGFYKWPYEIKALHKVWKYRQPEEQGFYME
ncbi:MAG: B12-binding domain-containing radical SAM protein [Flavobacteriales bacterium]|nr:B12-binding domain-containing radical SAM protein [Flavobacteriales bacterium]MCB9197807.1 B12-binding domain-containing radical SAM protein [Flavobacteriales bacterium]